MYAIKKIGRFFKSNFIEFLLSRYSILMKELAHLCNNLINILFYYSSESEEFCLVIFVVMQILAVCFAFKIVIRAIHSLPETY